MTIKLAPAVRFPGFTDVWEQRKLGDVVKNIGTGNSKFQIQEKSSDASYAILGSTSVIGYDNNFDFEGNFVLTARVGANAGTLYQHSGKVKISDNTVYIQSDNLSFLYNLLNRFDLKKLSFGTGQPLVKSSELKKLALNFPNKEEQEKIGNFFNQLDYTIALHQRKSTLLKQLKQTYLKQIFPQNKENIPALRFAGFSEPWKQHKFDEVFSHVQNNSLSRADLNYNGGYAMNIHYGDILIRFGEYLDVSKYQLPMIANKQLVEKYKASFLKDGDIVIADAAEDETVGKCSELGGIEDANILAGLHTIPSRPNWTFASGYLGYYMNSSAFHDQLLPLIQGTKISSISKSALKKTDIKYPHGKDEQTKIGNLFKQLDDSIALHQSKLEKLMDLKQVLLVKMFV